MAEKVSSDWTPGPWEVRTSGVFLRIVHGQHKTTVADGIVSEANGRLIAAAPELLAALLTKRDYIADAANGALTYEGSGEGFKAMAKEDLTRIDAAIAKARGEAA